MLKDFGVLGIIPNKTFFNLSFTRVAYTSLDGLLAEGLGVSPSSKVIAKRSVYISRFHPISILIVRGHSLIR